MTFSEWTGLAVAVAAWLTVLAYIVLAFYARSQINEAKELRAAQTADADRRADEARDLQRAKSRPFVVAEFVPGFLIEFRIRNVGLTLARNVRVQWDEFPAVTSTFASDPVWQGPDESSLMRDGVSFLPPGQDITTLFDSFPDRFEQNLPMQYKVTVSYQDFDESNHYHEVFVLDLGLYVGLRRIGRKDIDDVAKELGKIAKSMKKWTDTGSRGLKVSTVDRDEALSGERRSIRLGRFVRTRSEKGLVTAAREGFDDWRRRTGWVP